ncbi:MAG: tetratricopeptide repeat protein [Phycisphaerales bacterium]|nr:tetratricopeptide repeat protein [Phycisphaerales bacterium]
MPVAIGDEQLDGLYRSYAAFAGIFRAGVVATVVYLVVSMFPISAYGQTAATQGAEELVRSANAAYASGEYQEALQLYGYADVVKPESAEVAYNRGVTLYKMGDYVAARGALNKALSTRDLALEAKAKFNLGNVAYSSALEKTSAPQEAIELLKQAIGHYRDSLAVNPADEDALANIQSSQLLIKDLLDKLKQQQEQQQNQDQQQQGDQNQPQQDPQQDQSQQEQEDQSQQQDQQQQEKEKQQGEESQQEQQQDGSQGEADQKGELDRRQEQSEEDQQQAGETPSDVQEMTREEAERLLQSVRDREKERRDAKAQRMRARRVPVSKDW